MELDLKKRIIDAALAYGVQNKFATEDGSNNGVTKLSQLTNINIGYLSNMLNGIFTYTNSTKNTQEPIKDEYFEKLAQKIGFKLGKEYWKHITTSQFRDIIFELGEAKKQSVTRVLIGEAGCGKSYTISRFLQANPVGTFVVTCFREDSLSDLLRKIETQLHINSAGSRSERIDRIARELYKAYRRGECPVLIFDESESLTLRTFAMLKSLYDSLNWICSIVLIGTDDLIATIEKMKAKGKPGMPQFYRRFKAGIRPLAGVDRTFTAFFTEFGDIDPDLRKTLVKICENYGELHDYLEPVVKKAEEIGKPITDSFFRSYHKLPLNHLQKTF